MKTVNICGTEVHNVSWKETFAKLEELVNARRPSSVVTPNVDHVIRLAKDAGFRNVYDRASLVLADGMPLLWAAKILGSPLKAKVSGSDLFPRICEVAEKKGWKVFFLGGRPGAALKAAEVLQRRYPSLQVAGAHCPEYGFDKDPEQCRQIVSLIKEAKPDIVFVGVGSPKQENWVDRYKDEYGAPVSIGIGCSFEFVAGMVRRAPRFMQAIGLEWFWRLIMEPGRLWKRYLVDDIQFIPLVLRQKLGESRFNIPFVAPPAMGRQVRVGDSPARGLRTNDFRLDYLIWALLAALYIPVFRILYTQRWESVDYTHAYLILPVSLLLVWRKRAELLAALPPPVSAQARERKASTFAGLALFFFGLFLFVFGWRLNMLMLPTLSLIPVIFGVILYRYNARVARTLLFPVLYLLLIVPPPLGILDAVTTPMRYAATVATEHLLGAFFNIERDGLMLTIEHAQVFVGAPCSGFRSLISLFALALVYIHVTRFERGGKLVLLALTVPLAFIGNLLRVIVISIVTYYLGKEAGEGFFHGLSGVMIFAIMLGGLFMAARVMTGEPEYE